MKCPKCGKEAERKELKNENGILSVSYFYNVCQEHGTFARFPENESKPATMIVWGKK